MLYIIVEVLASSGILENNQEEIDQQIKVQNCKDVTIIENH